MKITEIFYSLQGEGRLAGMPSVFIRLSGCPLRCKWCDTKYALQDRCGNELSIDEILLEVNTHNCSNVVITGGEPFTKEQLPQLTEALKKEGKYITVETAGIEYIRSLDIDLVSISPKLANSTPAENELAALHEKNRLNTAVLRNFLDSYKCQLKFVVEYPADVEEIKGLINRLGNTKDAEIMLMTQAATTRDYIEKSREIAELCINEGFSFSPRLHIMLWGDKRGV